MTETDSTGYSDNDSASSTESKPNWRRDLENRLKDAEARASDAENRVSSYERRDTFRSAGLDPDDSRVKYFVKAYEGEMDTEAIRSEAEAAGFLGSDNPSSTPSPALQNAMQAEQRIAAAGEGGDPVVPTDLDDRIKATNSTDELQALMESEGYHWNASQ